MSTRVAGGIYTDLKRWPAVLVRPPETVSDDDLREYLRCFDHDVIGMGEPYGIVLDLRTTKSITPSQRQILTDSMASHSDADMCRGTAMVFESRLLRGILTAIFWVRRPAYPTRVFTSTLDAWAWMEELFPEEEEGAPVGWRLQSRSSRDVTDPTALISELERRGVEASIHSLHVGGEPLYVAWTSPIAYRGNAMDLQAELALSGIDMSVVPVLPPQQPLARCA